MNWQAILEAVLTLLGGGAIGTFATLKYIRAGARNNVEKGSVEILRDASAILMENIVEPLRKELKEVRNERNQYRKAIERIGHCPYDVTHCPVRKQLQGEKSAGNDKPDNKHS